MCHYEMMTETKYSSRFWNESRLAEILEDGARLGFGRKKTITEYLVNKTGFLALV